MWLSWGFVVDLENNADCSLIFFHLVHLFSIELVKMSLTLLAGCDQRATSMIKVQDND